MIHLVSNQNQINLSNPRCVGLVVWTWIYTKIVRVIFAYFIATWYLLSEMIRRGGQKRIVVYNFRKTNR